MRFPYINVNEPILLDASDAAAAVHMGPASANSLEERFHNHMQHSKERPWVQRKGIASDDGEYPQPAPQTASDRRVHGGKYVHGDDDVRDDACGYGHDHGHGSEHGYDDDTRRNRADPAIHLQVLEEGGDRMDPILSLEDHLDGPHKDYACDNRSQSHLWTLMAIRCCSSLGNLGMATRCRGRLCI
jgi:hypothetical protein